MLERGCLRPSWSVGEAGFEPRQSGFGTVLSVMWLAPTGLAATLSAAPTFLLAKRRLLALPADRVAISRSQSPSCWKLQSFLVAPSSWLRGAPDCTRLPLAKASYFCGRDTGVLKGKLSYIIWRCTRLSLAGPIPALPGPRAPLAVKETASSCLQRPSPGLARPGPRSRGLRT